MSEGLDALETYIESNYGALSSKIFAKFKVDCLCEMDPKGTPGTFTEDYLLRLLNLTDEESPYTTCYDADWPAKYLECYTLKKLSQSRSIIDMTLQVIVREAHNLQKMVFSFRQDFNIAQFEL